MFSTATTNIVREVSGLFEPEEPVLRGEPFGLEHLEQHARHLGQSLSGERGAGDPAYAARIEDNGRLLHRAYREISAAVEGGEPLTPDAEWLLDNFSVIEEHLREIREDLPPGFYRELPKTAAGQPRVYELALELIRHTDSAPRGGDCPFHSAFQEIAVLSIGEVWAFPIMLRLGLIENLRRLAAQMLATRRCRTRASELVAAWPSARRLEIDFSSLDCCARSCWNCSSNCRTRVRKTRRN